MSNFSRKPSAPAKQADSGMSRFVFRQALGIPFTCTSTSEPVATYRDFQALNFAAELEHIHCSMEAQVNDEPCTLHAGEEFCRVQNGASLAVFGAPCPPYSKLRSKRFVDGSVRAHAEYDVMFRESLKWLAKHEPAVAVAEQVPGFDMPESTTVRCTPLDRPGAWITGLLSLRIWGSWDESESSGSHGSREH